MAIKNNIIRLLDDVDLLIKDNRYSSAHFFLTTVDEEIAKLYILLDMCRLDFKKHESILRCLCRAFYDHVLKYAYIEIHRLNFIDDFYQAQEMWDIETKKWWPSHDLESGEPDMPHTTYFSREASLYVDYIEYNQKWSIPSNERKSFYFEKMFGHDDLSISKQHLEIIKTTDNLGFFQPQSLSVMHDIFKGNYIKDNINMNNLNKLYRLIDEKMSRDLDTLPETLFKTILFSWPLYHLLNKSRKSR